MSSVMTENYNEPKAKRKQFTVFFILGFYLCMCEEFSVTLLFQSSAFDQTYGFGESLQFREIKIHDFNIRIMYQWRHGNLEYSKVLN